MRNDDAALQFGERLIALLDGGRFTATYKFAVLIASSTGASNSLLAKGDR